MVAHANPLPGISQPVHHRWMSEALVMAKKAAALGEVPVGALVVRGETLLATAHNRCQIDADPTAHAEILAIRAAGQELGDWRLEGCILYVTLEPCPMCMGAALNARMGAVVYGAQEPKAGACGSVTDLRAPPGYNHALEVLGGVAADDSAALLKAFFRDLRQRSAQSARQS